MAQTLTQALHGVLHLAEINLEVSDISKIVTTAILQNYKVNLHPGVISHNAHNAWTVSPLNTEPGHYQFSHLNNSID